jgi:hypothetical protein
VVGKTSRLWYLIHPKGPQGTAGAVRREAGRIILKNMSRLVYAQYLASPISRYICKYEVS